MSYRSLAVRPRTLLCLGVIAVSCFGLTIASAFQAASPPPGTPAEASASSNNTATEPLVADASNGNDVDDTSARITFNFESAPWSEVLKSYADFTKMPLDVIDMPPGTFSYSANRKYTPTESLDVLNSLLIPRGFLIVRRENQLTVINLEDASNVSTLATIVTPDEIDQHGRHELLRVEFRVLNNRAEDVAKEWATLMSPIGRVVPLKRANHVLVLEFGGNLRKIRDLYADFMHQPDDAGTEIPARATPTDDLPLGEVNNDYSAAPGTAPGVYRIEHADAVELIQIIKELYRLDYRVGSLVADPRTNVILYRGHNENGFVEKLDALLRVLDVPAVSRRAPRAGSGGGASNRFPDDEVPAPGALSNQPDLYDTGTGVPGLPGGGRSSNDFLLKEASAAVNGVQSLRQQYRRAEQRAAQLAKKRRLPANDETDLPRDNVPDTKAVIGAVTQAFDARQELQAAELVRFEARLNALRQTLDNRARLREQIIRRRVEDLLSADDLSWPVNHTVPISVTPESRRSSDPPLPLEKDQFEFRAPAAKKRIGLDDGGGDATDSTSGSKAKN